MLVVNISGDYPDSFQPRKTNAVSSLVEGTRNRIDHHVYSINRVGPDLTALIANVAQNPLNPPLSVQFSDAADGVTTVTYDGLPGGLYLNRSLIRLAAGIAEDLERKGIRPDLIHGHKLTIEGIVAEALAGHFDCPYALSIQVNTDRKILKYKPDLRASYRRIYHHASVVFPFSVVGQRACDMILGSRSEPTVLLPCTSTADKILPPRIVGPVLASVFHLKDYANKNAVALVKASSRLQMRHRDFRFHLYGGGTEQEIDAVGRLAENEHATSFELKGPLPHDRVQETLNGMCGFAMVSKRETFGMVFLEALLAGCPVIYPTNWAIDGFFDSAAFAVGVPSDDFSALEDAMEHLIRDQKRVKQSLRSMQEDGAFRMFQREAVLKTYLDAVHLAVKQ